jgi:2-oxoglutarate dehydrogenase E2 component (dihydrolipoamide succinyltransferase)
MVTKVLVPLLGEGVEEVTVIKWLKKEGDSINELEPLLEVNTDKVDTEIPAPTSGTVLKILAEEGTPAKVGAVLAFIGKPGESVESGAGGAQSLETKSTVPQRQEMSPRRHGDALDSIFSNCSGQPPPHSATTGQPSHLAGNPRRSRNCTDSL